MAAWRYEICLTPLRPGATRARFSAVPARKLPDQPNSGPEEGWGAPFEVPKLWGSRVLHGAPPAENVDLFSTNASPRKSQARQARQSSLMQAQGSQQVSLLTNRPIPGPAAS